MEFTQGPGPTIWYRSSNPAGYTVSVTTQRDGAVGVYQAVHGSSKDGNAAVVAIMRDVDMTVAAKRKAAAQAMRAACEAHHAELTRSTSPG